MALIFVAAVVGGLAITSVWGAEEVVAEGAPAPPFSVDLIGGGRFDLVRHLEEDGRPLLLNLWASWCLPCLREFPVLSLFADQNPGVAVLGVAVQDQLEPATAFVGQLRPRFPVAFDSDGSFRSSYPSFGLPTTFLIGSDGVVRQVIPAELTPERLADLDL